MDPKTPTNPLKNAVVQLQQQQRETPTKLSLDIIVQSQSTPTTTPTQTPTSLPLHELLLLSPSPYRKPRARLADRLEMASAHSEESLMELIGSGSVKRSRRRSTRAAVAAGLSPRNNGSGRRSRRRFEMDEGFVVVEEKEKEKVKKRRHVSKSTKKEKEKQQQQLLLQSSLSLVPAAAFSSPRVDVVDAGDDIESDNFERFGVAMHDLIMWKDVARTSLWFGFGCMCFMSSCFTKGINFSTFSALSQIGLLCLGASFLSNSLGQRHNVQQKKIKLREEDILRVGRLILPAANLVLSKTRELFSGEPSMTLKVIPFLLLGAEYGHLITLWRLCAIGFFGSFTLPKLYSCYSSQINQKAEYAKRSVLDAWGACSHKKAVAATILTAFWNLSGLRTRIFTAFITVVIVRLRRQQLLSSQEVEAQEQQEQKPEEQALVLASEPKISKKHN